MPKEYSISNFTKFGLTVGLLVLLGAGCGNVAKPVSVQPSKSIQTESENQIQPEASPGRVLTLADDAILSRSCISRPTQMGDADAASSTVWEETGVYKFYEPLFNEGFHPDFGKAIQAKLDAGWKFSIACNEQNGGPMLFFSMFKDNGSKHEVIVGTFNEELDSASGGIKSVHRFSEPIELQGDVLADRGIITDLWRADNGSIQGRTTVDMAVGVLRQEVYEFNHTSLKLKRTSTRNIN